MTRTLVAVLAVVAFYISIDYGFELGLTSDGRPIQGLIGKLISATFAIGGIITLSYALFGEFWKQERR